MSATRLGHAYLDEVYPTLPFEPVSGHGVWLEDESGRRVLDFYGGHAVALLGYGHPKLTEALAAQAGKLHFQSNVLPLKVRDEAARKLAEFSPRGLDRVFLVNSGAEANENALRIALKLTGRKKIVAVEHGFHGRTAAAAAVTWGSLKSWYGFPRPPMDVAFVPRNDIAALHAAVDDRTAAVIVEPVQGLAGAFDLSTEFLRSARQACDRNDALLILDEVQTGMGRLGEPFGADLFRVQPDLLTTAKGLAGGFPCGAVIMTPTIAAELKPGELGTTFGGNPMACAGIIAVIDAIEQERLLPRVRELSALIRQTCVVGPVKSVRGAGFLLGLRTEPPAAKVRDALLERDILAGTSTDKHVLRLLPPLILEAEHVKRLAGALEEIGHAAL
ncbi:MAG TPA: aminotransferase class III-fold pyridoxal phosphate-dependent enzyme [Gammaproteobacteria bacterium]|nr:aminotransferase class III-fold pyridoxal phosphate-dependent enzyme [Gammaproteobacteria bacterium]